MVYIANYSLRIQLLFDDDFHIEYDDYCSYDWVSISNGLHTIKPVAKLCGNEEEHVNAEDPDNLDNWLGPYISESNTMSIHFHSDDQYNEKGFRATLSIVE